MKLMNFFERITPAFPNLNKELPPNKLLPFVFFYTKGFRKSIAYLIVLSTLVALIEISLFGFMGKLVDWLSTLNKEIFWQEKWWLVALMGGGVIIVFPVIIRLYLLINYQNLMGNLPMAVRWGIHNHLLKQSVSFYQEEFAGRLATKLMQTSLALRETVIKLVDVLVYISVLFVSMLFILIKINFYLALPLIVFLVIYLSSITFFLPRLRKVSEEQADARSTMTGRVVDAYANINTIKLFAHTQEELNYSKDSMQGFLKTVYGQMRLVTSLIFSVNMQNYLLAFFTMLVSVFLWQSNKISIGDVALASALALKVNGISHWLMFELSSFFENLGVVKDGMNTLSKPMLTQDKENAPDLKVNSGGIEFNKVKFQYNQPKKNAHQHTAIINELNLSISPGERIGIVGKSGAGKSTLINLLLRFYDLDSGKITIDNQNIAEVTQNSLRKQIAVVTQDTSLLHRTVRENILYGNPKSSEEMLQKVLIQAKVDVFINSLADEEGHKGLDAKVGERGVKLSGGQRQRIALARALLKDAPILILDEATSALDSQTEMVIQENLTQLMENKTVVAIAHRLSTIANMDRLIVIDNGQVVEQGNHNELIALKGIYSELWKHQTNGFLGE